MAGELAGLLSDFWLYGGQMPAIDVLPPDDADLIEELSTLRRRGLAELGKLNVPALEQAVRAAGRVESDRAVSAFMIEAQLRDAVAEIDGDHGIAASIVLGLDGGRNDRPSELRKMAADQLHVSVSRFRHHHEKLLIAQIAHYIQAEIYEHQLQLARLRRDVRTPVGSRLAVEWLERFQAMYRIWTPITGLGNDLTAYRSTLLESDRPWDREPDPADPNDDGYTQERQAAGYVTTALYHHTNALWAERQFEIKYGGVWLLPDAQAEEDISKAVHRTRLASPNNERDDSHMRTLLSNVTDQELDSFLVRVAAEDIAMDIHQEWQDWAETCECTWTIGERRGREYFPTHLNHPGINAQCDLHLLVAACNDYCLILDDAWDQIADWYRDVPVPTRKNTTAEEIYALREHPLPGHIRGPRTPHGRNA